MRSLVVSAAVAGLVLVPGGMFAAANSAPTHGVAVVAKAKVTKGAGESKSGKGTKAVKVVKGKESKPVKPAKPAKPLVRRAVIYGGTLSAVDSTSGTITFVVRGGREKALRNRPLTLAVPSTAKVTRNDATATLAQLVAGDLVNVKGTQVGDAVTVTRVSASGAVTAPAEPTPAPTTPTEPTPAPTSSTEPTP